MGQGEAELQKAGREAIKLVLTLLYCLQDDDTPAWARAIIIGALLYFITPVDAVPDVMPGGYADDLAVLGGGAGTHQARAPRAGSELGR